ncbi:RelA/SpoT protein [Pectobacterium carotovorum subsp. carotovorum]|uniref:RelA/SpoT protein n=1 Tax=Pectobacterium carotovorum TaxID=554 RepID=UPI001373B8ED|nr:RelA/SpoT protein [Pectobacterium carotovorum]QHP53806.1 RelA/SpoT protein [Pectobacterium carotovorum subsp. carotovorum]
MKIKVQFTDGVRKGIVGNIMSRLDNLGIMYRIFSRTKNLCSLNAKIKNDERYGVSKKIQDGIGIRVVLYFSDDVEIAHKVISRIFSEREKDLSIDVKNNQTFEAVRYNIVYDIPEEMIQYISLSGEEMHYVDSTFELQLRTVFSEGWHEVEHDLRYKSKNDWSGYDNESRKLNGVYATLETSEWTMLQIFDELSYQHYKAKNWIPMFRQKFRIRVSDFELNENLHLLFNENNELVKSFFRIDRRKMLIDMASSDYSEPLKLDNIIYFCNEKYVKNEDVRKLTPELFLDEISS